MAMYSLSLVRLVLWIDTWFPHGSSPSADSSFRGVWLVKLPTRCSLSGILVDRMDSAE